MRPLAIQRRAFTLVEVLIVVIILGILAALVVPQFTSAANDAKAASAISQQRTIALQLDLYRARWGVFPTAEAMEAAPTNTDLGSSFGILIDQGYIRRAPVNPYTNGDVLGTDWTYDILMGEIAAVIP